MLDTDKLIEMYKNDYSLRDLSTHFGYDPRTIKSILKKHGVRIRGRKRAILSYSNRERREKIKRVKEVGYIKENRGNKPKGKSVNPSREWILLNIARGYNSSKKLWGREDCPYSSRDSLSKTLRRLRCDGMIEYRSAGFWGITDIDITDFGKSRVFEPTLAEEIKRINKLYPHLSYQEIALMVGCDRTYPRIVLAK